MAKTAMVRMSVVIADVVANVTASNPTPISGQNVFNTLSTKHKRHQVKKALQRALNVDSINFSASNKNLFLATYIL